MISVYSPLRISFAGGGTDISPFFEKYGGAVVNATIDRGINIRYTDDKMPLEVSSRDFLKSALISSDNTLMENHIINLFTKNGITTGRLIMNSGAPPGSGLGSSSALLNGLLKIIYTIKNNNINDYDLAYNSYKTEKDSFKIILGKQDPYAISIGGFKFMKFLNCGEITEKFDINNEFINDLEKSLLLVYTGKTRESSDALREQVEKSENNDNEVIEKLFKLKDFAYNMKKAIKTEDINDFCNVINEGWSIKKTLGNNITNNNIEKIIKYAHEHGSMAEKLLGGGSQGFILLYTDYNNIPYLQKSMMDLTDFVIRLNFDNKGTRIIKM